MRKEGGEAKKKIQIKGEEKKNEERSKVKERRN